MTIKINQTVQLILLNIIILKLHSQYDSRISLERVLYNHVWCFRSHEHVGKRRQMCGRMLSLFESDE